MFDVDDFESDLTANTSKRIATRLVADVGCNATLVDVDNDQVMACLRHVDAKNLLVAQWNSYFGILGFPLAPTIDGVLLPKHPVDLLKDGDYKVPLPSTVPSFFVAHPIGSCPGTNWQRSVRWRSLSVQNGPVWRP